MANRLRYIFDSTIMWIALVIYNVVHPGRLMRGKEADLPSGKLRRGLRKQGLVMRGRLGADYLLPKYQSGATSRDSSPQHELPQ